MGLKIVNKSNNPLPAYAHAGDAGMDIRAFINKPITLNPGERALIGTGIFLQIPRGFECQVRSRSGLAIKYGVCVLNSPGCIDSCYTGEVGVILINLGQEDFVINSGDRIAQLIFSVVAEITKFEVVDVLDETDRGALGFGSTGVK